MNSSAPRPGGPTGAASLPPIRESIPSSLESHRDLQLVRRPTRPPIPLASTLTELLGGELGHRILGFWSDASESLKACESSPCVLLAPGSCREPCHGAACAIGTGASGQGTYGKATGQHSWAGVCHVRAAGHLRSSRDRLETHRRRSTPFHHLCCPHACPPAHTLASWRARRTCPQKEPHWSDSQEAPLHRVVPAMGPLRCTPA